MAKITETMFYWEMFGRSRTLPLIGEFYCPEVKRYTTFNDLDHLSAICLAGVENLPHEVYSNWRAVARKIPLCGHRNYVANNSENADEFSFLSIYILRDA